MNFGLSEAYLKEIKSVIARHSGITQAIIFGSRAMGNFKNSSDVDIALKGNIDWSVVATVLYELEENTAIPYFFDVVDYQRIDNDQLKKHIDDHGIVFYEAGSGLQNGIPV